MSNGSSRRARTNRHTHNTNGRTLPSALSPLQCGMKRPDSVLWWIEVASLIDLHTSGGKLKNRYTTLNSKRKYTLWVSVGKYSKTASCRTRERVWGIAHWSFTPNTTEFVKKFQVVPKFWIKVWGYALYFNREKNILLLPGRQLSFFWPLYIHVWLTFHSVLSYQQVAQLF